MKIKLITSVAIDGLVRKPGDEIEVSRSVGNDLIGRKRAVSLDGPPVAGVIASDALEDKPKRGRKPKPTEGTDGTDGNEGNEGE